MESEGKTTTSGRRALTERVQGNKAIYLIGSLRNPQVVQIAAALRDDHTEIFDNWVTAGEAADESWAAYERFRGHTYQQALDNHSAKHVYSFDYFHLNRCHAAVLTLPAGRSGHLEAGFAAGQGKPVFLLLDSEGEPERLDVMSQFLYRVCPTIESLQESLASFRWPKLPEMPMVTVTDVMWLSGLWEGDGSYCISGPTPRMVLQMTDRDVIAKAAQILNSNVWKLPPTVTGKTVWACGRVGLAAIEWMRIMRPYMGARRQQQIVSTAQEWLMTRKCRTQDREWWERIFNLQGVA